MEKSNVIVCLYVNCLGDYNAARTSSHRRREHRFDGACTEGTAAVVIVEHSHNGTGQSRNTCPLLVSNCSVPLYPLWCRDVGFYKGPNCSQSKNMTSYTCVFEHMWKSVQMCISGQTFIIIDAYTSMTPAVTLLFVFNNKTLQRRITLYRNIQITLKLKNRDVFVK